VGSIIFVLLQEVTRTWFGFAGASLLIVGVTLVPVVLFLPEGVLPSVMEKIRSRRRASRHARRAQPPAPAESTLFKSIRPPPDEAEELLRVEGLSRRFGGVQAVSEVSFACRRGERLAVIGPNGAGKSTLFALLGGFVHPDAGQIWFKDKRIDGLEASRVCFMGLARTFQTAEPFRNLTVFENVLASAYLRANNAGKAEATAHAALDLFGLADLTTELSRDLNVAGQKRLEIARAFATQPDLILLDEVGAGLTPIELDELTKILRAINEQHLTTIIFIEHVMSMVSRLAQRVIVLHHGQVLVIGSPHEVSSNQVVIDAYLGEAELIAEG
jgi:ABC-type branched-subunit amino acid transport system ATPase component